MDREYFDVAVITEGLNGLFSAYEFARNGASVVVVDNYNPSLEIDGYIFDYYPEHIFSYNELPEVFRYLNIPFEAYTSPALHLILPDRRVDVYSHIERSIAEIKKRFRWSYEDIIAYLLKEQDIIALLSQNRVSPSGHAGLKNIVSRLNMMRLLKTEKQHAHKILKRLSRDNPLFTFVRAISVHMFPWQHSDEFMDMIPFLLQKSFYPVGGKGSIKKALIDKLIELHVRIIQSKKIDHIEKGKHFTISLVDEQPINSKAIIAEPLYESTLSRLPLNASKYIKRHFYVDNMFIGIHRLCLPEVYNRVNHAVIVSDYRQELFNDNLIFIFNNPISDIKRAKDEMAALTACTLIKEDNLSKLQEIRNSVLKHLKDFMPFFDEYVENIYFTQPYILWRHRATPLYKKGVLLVNDEFINKYTFDAKYAYIKDTVKGIS